MVEARAGIAVPAGDVDRLVIAVLQLFHMSQENRKEMGVSGHRYFLDHFDHEKLVQQMLTHLENLTNKE